MFSRSFFSDPRELSAAELLLMFHIYFLGSSEGLLFDVPDDPFPQALWEPLGRYLERLGVDVRTGAPVDSVRPSGGTALSVDAGGTSTAYDAVVLALDVTGLQRLVEASPGLGDEAWRSGIAAQRTAPPFLVSRLWLDRPVARSRPGFLGTSGFGGLDNVSVLDRWEGRRSAGRGVPVAASWNCTVTPSKSRPTATPSSANCCGSFTRSTRRPPGPGSSTPGTNGVRTARCSPSRATSPVRR